MAHVIRDCKPLVNKKRKSCYKINFHKPVDNPFTDGAVLVPYHSHRGIKVTVTIYSAELDKLIFNYLEEFGMKADVSSVTWYTDGDGMKVEVNVEPEEA